MSYIKLIVTGRNIKKFVVLRISEKGPISKNSNVTETLISNVRSVNATFLNINLAIFYLLLHISMKKDYLIAPRTKRKGESTKSNIEIPLRFISSRNLLVLAYENRRKP